MKKTKISPEFLQKVKDSVNLVEVVGEHVVLRKAGAHFTGLCPFHSERSPSFSVSESKQLYHCYGCKKGGDLFTFLMEVLGISFPEAVEEVAERSRIALPAGWKGGSSEENAKRVASREKNHLAFKLNRFAAAYFHQTLGRTSSFIEYFLQRGVTEELGKAFYLGAATDSWDGLAAHFIAKKAPLELAAELGIIRPSKRVAQGSSQLGYFDLFRNRVIFPILNLRGKVAGFGGRTIGSETPKYLNSSESAVFQKSKLAFGLYQAQRFIREKDEVVLVEGYFDVLAMYAAGFRNVVATCGTALTLDHLNLFKRFASKITVLFDGDQAGVLATDRAMVLGLEAGAVLYGAQLPVDQDPDEIVLDQGPDRMQEILAGAQPLLDRRIEETVASGQAGPEDRVLALKKIGGWLRRFEDPVGREVRIQLVQKQLGVDRVLIQKAMGPALLSQEKKETLELKVQSSENQVQAKSKRNGKLTQGDRMLLLGIAFGEEYSVLFAEARGHLPPECVLADLFDFLPAKEFMASLVSKPGCLEQLRLVPESLFVQELDPQVRSVLTEALLAQVPPVAIADFKSVLYRNIAKSWAIFGQKIKQALSVAEGRKDEGLQSRLMKEYLDVQRKMKEFGNFYDEE